MAFSSNSAALTQADIPAIVQQVLSSLSATGPTPGNGMGYPTCSTSDLLSSSPPASSEVTNVPAISVSLRTTGSAGSATSYCLRSLVHPSVTWVTPLCTTTSSVPRTSTNPTVDDTTRLVSTLPCKLCVLAVVYSYSYVCVRYFRAEFAS